MAQVLARMNLYYALVATIKGAAASAEATRCFDRVGVLSTTPNGLTNMRRTLFSDDVELLGQPITGYGEQFVGTATHAVVPDGDDRLLSSAP